VLWLGVMKRLQYADALMSLHQPFISDHSRLNCSSFANLAIKLLKTSFFFTLEWRECFQGFFLGHTLAQKVCDYNCCLPDRRPRATPMRPHIKRLIVVAREIRIEIQARRYPDTDSHEVEALGSCPTFVSLFVCLATVLHSGKHPRIFI